MYLQIFLKNVFYVYAVLHNCQHVLCKHIIPACH